MAVTGRKRKILLVGLVLVLVSSGVLWLVSNRKGVLRPGLATTLYSQTASAPQSQLASQPQTIAMAVFMPRKDGLKWVYRICGMAGERTLEQALKGEAYTLTNDMGDQADLYHRDGATYMSRQTLVQSGIDFTFSPALLLYPDTLEMGVPHQYDGPLTAKHPLPGSPGRGTVHWQVLPEGWQDVPTPAGEFKDCLRLKVTMTVSLSNYLSVTCEEYRWLARGVGLVRCKNAFRIELGGVQLAAQENTMELSATNAEQGP